MVRAARQAEVLCPISVAVAVEGGRAAGVAGVEGIHDLDAGGEHRPGPGGEHLGVGPGEQPVMPLQQSRGRLGWQQCRAPPVGGLPLPVDETSRSQTFGDRRQRRGGDVELAADILGPGRARASAADIEMSWRTWKSVMLNRSLRRNRAVAERRLMS